MNTENLHPAFQAALEPFIQQPSGETINITRLIEKAEELAYDGHMGMAAEGEAPVQIIEAYGKKFQLSVRMKLITE